MINSYGTDIGEIVALAGLTEAQSDSPQKGGGNDCLHKLGLRREGEWFNERAESYERAYASSSDFKAALANIWAARCKNSDCKNCLLGKYCNYNVCQLTSEQPIEGYALVDLFCGAGGLSLGFIEEGFRVVFANDIEPCCLDTYTHNHPSIARENVVLGDISDVLPKIKPLLGDAEVDIVIGGPPCQGFSMANRQRLIDDPRNRLYKKFVEAVGLLTPKCFVMENVKGMLPLAEQIVEDFRNIGYAAKAHVLNAKDFGVPQNRERLIFIGTSRSVDLETLFQELWEESAASPMFVLRDALFGLKPLKASRTKNALELDSETSGRRIDAAYSDEANEYINLINGGKKIGVAYNHKARYNNDRDIEIYSRLEQGDKSDDPKIADIMPYASRNHIFRDKYYKLEEDKVCKTITAHMKFDCNMYIHPTEARGLTPREAARVQSYPDDYYFRGAFTKTFMQIGNSVPPLLGRAIAKVIRKYLEEENNHGF